MEDTRVSTMHTVQRVIQRFIAYYFLFSACLITLWLALPSPLGAADTDIYGISSTTSFTRIYRTEDFPIGTEHDFFVMRFEVSPDERLVRIFQDMSPPIVVPLKHTENIATNPTAQLNVTDWVGRLADVRVSSHEGIVPSWTSTGDMALLSWQLNRELGSVDLAARYIEDKQKLASFQLASSNNLDASLLSVHWNDNCARPMFSVQFQFDPQSFPTSVTYGLRSLILSVLWPMNLALSYAFIYTLVFFDAIFGFYGIHIAIVFWSVVFVIVPLAILIGWRRVASKLPLTFEKQSQLMVEDGKSRTQGFYIGKSTAPPDIEAVTQQST